MVSRAGYKVALAAIALMLGACISFQSPLSAPGDSETDARLEGVWQGVSDGPESIFYAHVVPTDNGLIDVDWVVYGYERHPGDSFPLDWTRFRVFRTEIEGVQYLNATPVAGETSKKWEGPVYFIYKYDISQDGMLSIWGPSRHTLRRHIEEGSLAGMEQDYDTIVTDDPANLREYLRQGNDPFTKGPLTLRKILPKVPGQ